MENKVQKLNQIEKENNSLNLSIYKPLRNELSKILENQRISKKKQDQILETAQKGFIGLALRNEKLLKSNNQLKHQLDDVLKELNAIKQEREEKVARREKWEKRKRLPKRDPMTAEIYKELIKEAEGPTYINVRLRLALCLLAVTGIRINELLNIKVSDLITLIQEDWIAIDRSKRGPSNHKAFLTKEGKKIIRDRKKDFELIFLMKELDAYLFTSEADHFKKLRREAITKDVNKIMRSVSKQLPGQPNITSHSFRIGFITQLWKDSKDIEFVKQTIGHRNLDTSSAYVNRLSDQERQKRIDQLK
uniref:Putative integrase/recombinase protein n=1 Tax=Psammoneis obaidii TaxID=1706219 RepID=A0A2U9NRQ4_9STRA|nr:putative integrase/recombinase protein [Psammoneis obaidii]AWT39814.1 putative integrase/recombinase protein [Psammoneis obaidii]